MMEWVLRSPQIHSTFASLGGQFNDGYHIKENCNAALESILKNILTEDKYLRTYRRNISFGQNVTKDLIPLLVHAREDKTIELLIRILVNLTIPIECLLSVEVISRTDFGRHTVFEINNLLVSIKNAFTDNKTTKTIFEFLKKNLDGAQHLSVEQCANINNSLLLLRNILHIPEEASAGKPRYNGVTAHSVQNQIIWNIFSQSIDKILIKLMSIPESSNWGVTMVQLVALLYKDQHVVTLHKLLNLWLEASLSESSEDNESNTSPPDRGDDSSPMLTSDPTSDFSDTGGSGKSNDEQNSANENNMWNGNNENMTVETEHQFQLPYPADKPPPTKKSTAPAAKETTKTDNKEQEPQPKDPTLPTEKVTPPRLEKKTIISKTSDCGFGTQIENQESISTSSNEDDIPPQKPVHQKPHNPKQRANTKARTALQLQDGKRKKIVKRVKANIIINIQGLLHKSPTDDDISNILKEFTVDFLLKGYNSLVQTLHGEILSNVSLEIDTAHFFWLVTYFLKFATQIELDFDRVCSVLSYDIISYLTAEGVNLCEQFELAIKLDGSDLKPSIRRQHLVVTAIREFVQAIEAYKKIADMSDEDREKLLLLQVKMCETEELRSLMVLLLRHYNPKYHTKQYLQDLIVTNHNLLLFLDTVIRIPAYNGNTNMSEHIKQFATPEVMYQYGLLLADYSENGEFVNDCVFTLMHHVGGDLDCLICLFQPKILKTFTSIWKSEFEICDDWSDLIEYVINTFVKKPHTLLKPTTVFLETENFEDDQEPKTETKTDPKETEDKKKNKTPSSPNTSGSTKERWTETELLSLNWNYMKCSTSSDIVDDIMKLFKEEGITKSKESIISELYTQRLIKKEDFENVSKSDNEKSSKIKNCTAEEKRNDEIRKLCEHIFQDGNVKFLDWLQKVLLEACYAKICLAKRAAEVEREVEQNKETKVFRFEFFKKKANEFPVVSPLSYHALVYNLSIPLVSWNCEQAAICKDLNFLQLLHKIGFHMPVDTGKMFIRIPHFWTADYLYEIAGKIATIDTTKLKFSTRDISETSLSSSLHGGNTLPQDDCIDMLPPAENYYQITKQKHLATMVNYTPMPGSSFASEEGEHAKSNWLEMVQKAQDCKLSLNLNLKSEMDDLNEEDVIMQEDGEGAGNKHDDTYSEHLPEAEYNNSLCETASVASDLTRMYVSDEEDKSEVPVTPTTKDVHLPDDHECVSAEKRIRME